MSYWDFLGDTFHLLTGTVGGQILTAFLAALVIAGALFGCMRLCFDLYDGGHGLWNFIIVPAVVVATFLVVMFLAWITFGGLP